MKDKFLASLMISACLLISGLGYAKTIVAIDAGHGGKDPGATGKTIKLKEKDVTLAIAKELKSLLDKDPNFKAVMTRSTDAFIQLPQRTEIARKNKANYLVSIHADTSPVSNNLKGASVWVLSNRRANDELGKWLEDHEKQSELLGGAGSVLSNANERYLSQTVLDLQFSHSQRSGYELGKTVLSKLSKVTTLAKKQPQHASLSVLRSPDIPSILVETGFLSNPTEEKRLATKAYRRQLAQAIYNGLVEYNRKNPIEKTPKSSGSKSSRSKSSTSTNTSYHIVQQDETLYSISRKYNTTPQKLSKLNNIKNNKILVGQKLKLK